MKPCHYVAAVDGVVGVEEYKDGTATEITGIKVVDPNTISFTFTAPNALFPTAISELFIMPQHALKDIPPEEMKDSGVLEDQQIGTGPFKWDKYTPGESIELVRVRQLLARHAQARPDHPPSLQGPGAALLAFDAGEIHFTYITADEVARERENANAVVLPGNSGVDNGMGLNDATVPGVRRTRRPPGAAARRSTASRSSTTSTAARANIVPCLYGLPNLQGGVEPHAVRSGQGQGARRAVRRRPRRRWASSRSTPTTTTRCRPTS